MGSIKREGGEDLRKDALEKERPREGKRKKKNERRRRERRTVLRRKSVVGKKEKVKLEYILGRKS